MNMKTKTKLVQFYKIENLKKNRNYVKFKKKKDQILAQLLSYILLLNLFAAGFLI